jgi:hypothetical protein
MTYVSGRYSPLRIELPKVVLREFWCCRNDHVRYVSKYVLLMLSVCGMCYVTRLSLLRLLCEVGDRRWMSAECFVLLLVTVDWLTPSATSRVRLIPVGTRRRTEGWGEWRGNRRMEWVTSTPTLPRNVVYLALLTLMPTPRLPAVDWTDAPADLNGLVRFGERRNLVSVRAPSRFKRTIPGRTVAECD